MRVLIHSCCLLALFIGHDAFGSSSVSPDEEIQKNFQQLMDTNSCPNCNLSGAVLNRVDLSGANLEGANLAGAKLYLADLSGTNLKNANLQGTALGGADLADADLRGANLTGAVMEGAYLVGTRMDGSVITRRSDVEDDEPETGEVVYVDDEKKSKNLPFTNKAFVAGSPGPEETAAGESVDEKDQVAVVTEPSSHQIEDTGMESEKSSSQQDEPTQVLEPISKDSKKLVMIADAVVPEDAAQEKSRVEVNDKPVEKDTGEGIIPIEEDSSPVEEAALVEPAPEIDSKDAREQQDAPEIPVQQDAPEQVLADQDIQEEPPSPSESVSAELVADSDAQENADIQEKPEAPSEPVQAVQEESAPQDPIVTDENVEVQQEEVPEQPEQPEQEMSGSMMDREAEPGVILAEDTVVAEMVPVKEAVSDPAEVTAAQDIPPEQPVQEENVMVVEESEQVSLENDSPSPVQEEILQMEQEVQAAAVEAGSEEPPVQDLEKTGEDVVPGTEERDKELLVEMLLDDNRCVGCDLSGVDLSGRHLDEADLERANLRGANLSDVDLSEANLKGADLRETNLRDADLREADLYRANLSGADLTGARFDEALMDMVYSTGAIGADFEGALND